MYANWMNIADCPLRYNALSVTTSSEPSFLRGIDNHSLSSHNYKVGFCRASSISPGQVRNISCQSRRVLFGFLTKPIRRQDDEQRFDRKKHRD